MWAAAAGSAVGFRLQEVVLFEQHPRKQQEARLADHEVEVLLVLPGRPADPLIAISQRVARLAEQHTAQPAPVPVEQEVAQVPAQRLAVAEVVVPLDEFVPELGVLLLLDQLQAQRQPPGWSQSAAGAVREVAATGCCGPGRMFCVCLGGSVRMPACSSCSSRPRAAATRLPPAAVRQLRCSQIVSASSWRLRAGNVATVCWISAICRRANRLPKKVVDLSFSMRGSMTATKEPVLGYHRTSGLAC